MKNLRQNGKGKSDMKKSNMLLFDSSGILLQSNKAISCRTLDFLMVIGDEQLAWRNVYCGENRLFIYCRKWI